jgi:nitrate reductase gamma subunit
MAERGSRDAARRPRGRDRAAWWPVVLPFGVWMAVTGVCLVMPWGEHQAHRLSGLSALLAVGLGGVIISAARFFLLIRRIRRAEEVRHERERRHIPPD